MKLIIAGSRNVSPTIKEIDWAIGYYFSASPLTEVVSGTAGGADQAGERWARERGYPIKRFPADWGEFGKFAGKKRNGEMAWYADAALVFWDGSSNGSADMVTRMVERGKRVAVVLVEPRRSSAQQELLP